MDPQQQGQSDKKIVDIRKTITPGGDDSNDQIYSDQEGSQSQNQKSSLQQQQNEERWEDTPTREIGQSQSLQPLPAQFQDKALQKEQISEEKKEPGGQIPNNQNLQQKKMSEIKKQTNKQVNLAPRRKERQKQQKQMKSFKLCYDSKFIYAAFELLRQQLRKLIPPEKGYVKLNPYYNTRQIVIYYYDQKDKEQIAEIIDNQINQIQVMQMQKKQAESGVHLSYKFYQNLLKQKMSFFHDRSQNYKTASYYICGKVKKNALYQKIAQIRNMNFIWMNLFRYQNTRSYRAILRKILDTPQIHSFINQKFKAKQIQVAYERKDFPTPKSTKRGITILITAHGSRKISLHQQIQITLTNYIKNTFLVFCFVFKRKSQSYQYKYTPKIDKVVWFFISERTFIKSYLYIIVNKKDFKDLRQTIIKQIENMKLNIIGRRFFKNLYPQASDVQKKPNERNFSYPKNRPYSWTYQCGKGEIFDWISQLNAQYGQS